MFRRIKVIISALVVVVVLTVGSAATVMAEGEATPPEARAECLLARVAQILGISQEDLTNAFEQVRQEIREERCFTPGEQVQQKIRRVALIRSGEQARQEIREECCIESCEQMQQKIRRVALIRSGEQVQQQHVYGWRNSAKYELK
jgi:hypothetical protein